MARDPAADRPTRAPRRALGLTYIEMMAVLMILTIMALGALPMLHHRYRRMKESELRQTLAVLRDAIDRYHEYAVLGQIEPWDLDWDMYPKDLDMLVEGVEVKPSQDKDAVTVKFLRRIPKDPITGEAEWDCRGYKDDPDDRESKCDNLFDLFSKSDLQALDGTYYKDW